MVLERLINEVKERLTYTKTSHLQTLLESGNVSGALHLAETISSGSNVGLGFESLVRHVRARAAFVSLQEMELPRAKELFLGSNMDPREVRKGY